MTAATPTLMEFPVEKMTAADLLDEIAIRLDGFNGAFNDAKEVLSAGRHENEGASPEDDLRTAAHNAFAVAEIVGKMIVRARYDIYRAQAEGLVIAIVRAQPKISVYAQICIMSGRIEEAAAEIAKDPALADLHQACRNVIAARERMGKGVYRDEPNEKTTK